MKFIKCERTNKEIKLTKHELSLFLWLKVKLEADTNTSRMTLTLPASKIQYMKFK